MPNDDDTEVTILFIEKDKEETDIYLRMMQGYFPEMTRETALQPDVAIDLLKKKRYDIVVCDAFLALDDRIELANLLCSKNVGTLLIITGHSDLELASFPARSCIQAILHKPVNLKDLVDEIRNAVANIKTCRRTRRHPLKKPGTNDSC